MRFEIEPETHAVRVFADGAETPFLYQPHYPDGVVWESAEEATAWAELYVASVEDPLAPYAPTSRGAEGLAKPTPEEIQAMAAERGANDAERRAEAEAFRAKWEAENPEKAAELKAAREAWEAEQASKSAPKKTAAKAKK